jgi:hypothetical protein
MVATDIRRLRYVDTLYLLLALYSCIVGIVGSGWVLWDWLRERWSLRERQTRARLRKILHRRGPGQPCRRHVYRCVQRRRS